MDCHNEWMDVVFSPHVVFNWFVCVYLNSQSGIMSLEFKHLISLS